MLSQAYMDLFYDRRKTINDQYSCEEICAFVSLESYEVGIPTKKWGLLEPYLLDCFIDLALTHTYESY